MLHAPDFLGYEDAIQLAKDHPEIVEKTLKLKKIGNDLVSLLGGREIHPINVKVGGFYRVPTKKELRKIVDDLKWARDASYDTVKLTATFTFPEFEQDYEFVALSHPAEYPLTKASCSNKDWIYHTGEGPELCGRTRRSKCFNQGFVRDPIIW
jgi:coenzyme F420-reducing hydrogenase alpha subunit